MRDRRRPDPRRRLLHVARWSALALALSTPACGARGAERAEPPHAVTVSRSLEVYESLGFFAGPAEFPAVGTFATLAGPADSTLLLFALSLPTEALRFQREPQGFVARYSVLLSLWRDSALVRRIDRLETVRVGSFAETGRPEESIVFQTFVPLAPGEYHVDVNVRDALGVHGFRADDTLRIPEYGPAATTIAGPLIVYQAHPRTTRDELPRLIVNPRRTIAYGADSATLYVEAYGVTPRLRAALRADGEVDLWSAPMRFDSGAVATAIVPLPRDTLPVGRLTVQLRTDDDSLVAHTPLLVTISEQWIVLNFDEVLEILAYVALPEEMDSLRTSSAGERSRRWASFWERRDPLPATPVNEFREEFFERIRVANLEFREGGAAGWRTDRGQVYIVLGPPDHVADRYGDRGAVPAGPNLLRWSYERLPGGSLDLFFVDRTGFGRYELTPESRASFLQAGRRLRTTRP